MTTASTTPEQMQRFVEDNLANGVDHLFVCLDTDQPEAEDYLRRHEHVTHLRTDDSWWRGERPADLNRRQGINANIVNSVLAGFPGADWLFSIDTDEVALIAPGELDSVPETDTMVVLEVLEAVSRPNWEGEPTHFKRQLEEDELALLQVLGVIPEPTNGALFRSHLLGKAGIRPGGGRRLGLHRAWDGEGNELTARRLPGLRMLHFEGYSESEFVRKWSTMLGKGAPVPGFRPRRRQLALALDALLSRDLDEDRLRRYLERIFERHCVDDFETLFDLGFLEEHRPQEGPHRPTHLTPVQRAELAERLEGFRPEPKVPYLARPQ